MIPTSWWGTKCSAQRGRPPPVLVRNLTDLSFPPFNSLSTVSSVKTCLLKNKNKKISIFVYIAWQKSADNNWYSCVPVGIGVPLPKWLNHLYNEIYIVIFIIVKLFNTKTSPFHENLYLLPGMVQNNPHLVKLHFRVLLCWSRTQSAHPQKTEYLKVVDTDWTPQEIELFVSE